METLFAEVMEILNITIYYRLVTTLSPERQSISLMGDLVIHHGQLILVSSFLGDFHTLILHSLLTSQQKLSLETQHREDLDWNIPLGELASWQFYTYWSTIISRYACGFPDEDDNTYIITGGTETLTAVSRYNENGWIEDIPPGLKVQRYLHGCGTYLDDNNIRVSISHLP